MKERPIIFSTEMVKAILEGRKTQTRRVVKPQFKILHAVYKDASIETELISRTGDQLIHSPYGKVGDRLWVRETLRWSKVGTPTRYAVDDCPVFRDGETPSEWPFKTQILPSRFMPRWASRLTLEIAEVKVERLQEIELVDIEDEGIIISEELMALPNHKGKYLAIQQLFIDLWNFLNAKHGYPWESNPFCWVISFKKVGN